MKRDYFGVEYEWINKEHMLNETRAFALFKHGQLLIRRKKLIVEPRHLALWLEKELIREVK